MVDEITLRQEIKKAYRLGFEKNLELLGDNSKNINPYNKGSKEWESFNQGWNHFFDVSCEYHYDSVADVFITSCGYALSYQDLGGIPLYCELCGREVQEKISIN